MFSKKNFPYNLPFKIKLNNTQMRKNRDSYEQVIGKSGRCRGDINCRINNYVNLHLHIISLLLKI